MDQAIRQKILSLLSRHRIMTVATLRPDGWPQATTVGYANDDLEIYFCCGRDSQKAENLAHDDRISLTINHDPDQVMKISALSMGARASNVEDPKELETALGLIKARYAWQRGVPAQAASPDDVLVFRVTPEVISLIDYSKGFGHSDLVHC